MIKRLTGLLLLALFSSVTAASQDITALQADSFRMVLESRMPDTTRLDILFRLAEFYIVKPGDDRQDLDLATRFLKNADAINETLHSADISGFHLLISSLLAKEKKQEKQGKEMAEKAVSMLAGSSNKYYTGRAYFNLSDYYHYSDRSELVEKIRLVELAVHGFAQSKYIETYAYSLKHLADLYEINEQRTKVLENLNLALKLYKSVHYPRLYGVYVLYNRYYFLGGNYKLALDYGLMALQDAESAGDSTMSYCQINNYLAITQVRLKERERAIGYYNTALRIAEKYNENPSVLMLMNNMVQNYIELQKPQDALALMKGMPENFMAPDAAEGRVLIALNYARIFFELKKFAQANVFCNQLIDLIRVHPPRAQVVNDTYLLLIRFYLASGQYVLAKTYHQKIDSLSRKMGDPARIKENYYLAFRLDTANGSYHSAVVNLLKYQNLHDSLFDETNTRQMQQLEVEYETQKNKNELKIKDQDIVLLHQQNQLQQNHLQSAGMLRNFIVAGIGLLLVIIALLWRQYQQKQKSNDVITGKNDLLQGLVREKEWLLKEIHHRVKNNLQIVMSLLSSQSAYLENGAALSAIQDSQHRVHAMSLIHQKLFNAANVSSIEMSSYIGELVTYLRDSFNAGQRIVFEYTIEPLTLGESQAVPLGLILNEAITNSLKYAFPDRRHGVITISLTNTFSNQYLLVISDNGIGMPRGMDTKRPESLGMSLMAGLSEDLEGKLTIENDNGTVISILFSDDSADRGQDTLISTFTTSNHASESE